MNHHRQLIITGMHRSGTSFMANWMQSSGLFIGDNLAGATPSNVKGHFEDIGVLELHERMLKANGTTMYMHEKQALKITANFVEEANELCHLRQKHHLEWGWKQPRATLFLDLWNEVLPNAKYLIPMRDPTSVINSIVRREANKFLLRHDEITGPKLHAAYLENLADHVRRYDGMYVVHCRRLLQLLQGPKRDDCLIVNFHKIESSSKEISDKLKSWGFGFHLIPYQDLFEESLLIQSKEYLVPSSSISEEAQALFQSMVYFST